MFCLGGFCPGVFVKGGFCPGGFCPGVYVRGGFVLEPDTQPQDQGANFPEVVVDSEDMGNQTDSSHIDIVTVDDDDGSTSTPTFTKISHADISGNILLFGNSIKNLELSPTKKSDKVKSNGDMTELKDFVALVEGTSKNNVKGNVIIMLRKLRKIKEI